MRRPAAILGTAALALLIIALARPAAAVDATLVDDLAGRFRAAVDAGDDPFSALLRALADRPNFTLDSQTAIALADRLHLPADSPGRSLLASFISLTKEGNDFRLVGREKKTIVMPGQNARIHVGEEASFRLVRNGESLRMEKIDGLDVERDNRGSLDWLEFTRSDKGPRVRGSASWFLFSEKFDIDLAESARRYRAYLAEIERPATPPVEPARPANDYSLTPPPHDRPSETVTPPAAPTPPAGTAPVGTATPSQTAPRPAETPGLVGALGGGTNR